MALNDITFVKGKGGLGRPLAGKDFISGLIFFIANAFLPAGFKITDRIKQIFSVQDAEDLGIKKDYNDETQASGNYSITALGATGDSINLRFLEPNGFNVSLATFVATSAENSVTLLASAIASAINARTYITGYTATSAVGVITIKAKKGLGIYPNAIIPISAVISGTIAGTAGAFAGGVASVQAVWAYHIAEFFRQQPKGSLWLSLFEVPTAYNYDEIRVVQNYTNGDIRQMGVYVDSKTFAVADVTTIQNVCNTLDVQKMPLSVILAPDINGTPISGLADLSIRNANKVSVLISQDGAGLGYSLYKAKGKSITTLGATLGAIAKANVQEDIAWVGKFDQSNGVELESIAFANGVNFNDASVSAGLLDATDLKRYIFLRKFPNLAGSYYNDSHTAISQGSDYAFIESNRVIDKAIRGVYQSLLPSLNSPLLLNADGTLANSTIAYLESQAVVITDNMVRSGEASAIAVSIDPVQNVASSSKVVVAINLIPIGVARNIIVNIGFKTSL